MQVVNVLLWTQVGRTGYFEFALSYHVLFCFLRTRKHCCFSFTSKPVFESDRQFLAGISRRISSVRQVYAQAPRSGDRDRADNDNASQSDHDGAVASGASTQQDIPAADEVTAVSPTGSADGSGGDVSQQHSVEATNHANEDQEANSGDNRGTRQKSVARARSEEECTDREASKRQRLSSSGPHRTEMTIDYHPGRSANKTKGGYRKRTPIKTPTRSLRAKKGPASGGKKRPASAGDEDSDGPTSSRYRKVSQSKLLGLLSSDEQLAVRRRFQYMMLLRDGIRIRRGIDDRTNNAALIGDAAYSVLTDDRFEIFKSALDEALDGKDP